MADSPKQATTGFRWLLRAAAAMLLLLIITAAFWSAWWRHAHGKMDQLIADLRSRGEMVDWAELDITDIPNSENAAFYYKRASTSLTPAFAPPTGRTGKSLILGSPAWLIAAQTNVPANSAALASVKKARPCTQASWVPPQAGLSKTFPNWPVIPQYPNVSNLARLIRDNAVLEHLKGNDREAIESWRDTVRLSRAVPTEPLVLIAGLISHIVDNIGLEAIAQIAPSIRVGDAEGAISPDETRQLIAQLLDDSFARHTLANAFRRERLSQTTVYIKGLQPSPWLLQPLILDELYDGIQGIESTARDIEQLRVSPSSKPSEHQRVIAVIPQFTNVSTDVIQHVVRRRMLATVLAIRLFAHENSRYPDRIEELVPRYLPSVPTDPRPACLPVAYWLREQGTRPVICMGAQQSVSIPAQVCNLPATIGTSGAIFLDASKWTDPASTQKSSDGKVDQPQTTRNNDKPDNRDQQN